MYVLNFGTVGDQILVKKKDPHVCPEFWYGRGQDSSEKKPPSVVATIDTTELFTRKINV